MDTVFVFGPFRLDERAGDLTRDGKRVRVEARRPEAARGDRALADAAAAGFRFFGLDEVAKLVEQAAVVNSIDEAVQDRQLTRSWRTIRACSRGLQAYSRDHAVCLRQSERVRMLYPPADCPSPPAAKLFKCAWDTFFAWILTPKCKTFRRCSRGSEQILLAKIATLRVSNFLTDPLKHESRPSGATQIL